MTRNIFANNASKYGTLGWADLPAWPRARRCP